MNDDDVDGNVLKVSSFDDQHKSRSHQQPEERTQPQCHTAAHPLQLKLQPPPSIPPVTDMTSPMTKTEIIEEFARLGELPPKSWSHTECLFRMEELRAQGLTANPRAKSKTPLQLKMTVECCVSEEVRLGQVLPRTPGSLVGTRDHSYPSEKGNPNLARSARLRERIQSDSAPTRLSATRRSR